MASKLLKIDINPRLILWIVDFLVNRSQKVRHQAVLSSSRSVSTGFPQSAMEDLSNSDSVYFAEVERFSNCCRGDSFDSNVKKTKEMLIDFRKAPTVIPDLFIGGMKVERVTEYKYVGTVLDNKLNFNQTLTLFTKESATNILPLKTKIS